jgi:probable phosphoglycerate mutase
VSDPVRLLLARHGQTEWHADNRYVSRTDIALTEAGYEQARALAHRAQQEKVDLVLSSPLGRALLTAKPAAAARNLEPETDERLRELDFGEWEGRTLSEIREEDPESVKRFEESAEHGFPSGEPLHEGADRVLDVFADLSRSQAGGTVLVVTHNTLLRLALCRMLGVELGQYRRLFPRVLNGALSEVRFNESGGALYSFNDTGGPE